MGVEEYVVVSRARLEELERRVKILEENININVCLSKFGYVAQRVTYVKSKDEVLHDLMRCHNLEIKVLTDMIAKHLRTIEELKKSY